MASIFSVQNLHTFLRRKNFRPPGPPGPPSRPPPGPERGGRRSPDDPSVAAGAGLVSSAMLLLRNIQLLRVGPWLSAGLGRAHRRPQTNSRQAVRQRRYYAVAAGASPAGSAVAGAGPAP